jgi:hypothetical protein
MNFFHNIDPFTMQEPPEQSVPAALRQPGSPAITANLERCDESVQFGNEQVGINAVNSTSLFYIFTAGHCTAHAMHADFLEQRHGLGSIHHNISNNGFFGNLEHIVVPPIFLSCVIITTPYKNFNPFFNFSRNFKRAKKKQTE